MKTLADLGLELQALRKASRKPQRELAAEASMRQDALSRLERGRGADFSLAKLLRLAQALGVDVVLVPSTNARPTLESVLSERKQGTNVGPNSR